MIRVPHDQGSIALRLCIYSPGLAGFMEITMRATLPNFALLAVFCHVVLPSPETASSQSDSKPGPDARDQRKYLGLSIKALRDKIAKKMFPDFPSKTATFANFGILTAHGDPVVPGCWGIRENQVA